MNGKNSKILVFILLHVLLVIFSFSSVCSKFASQNKFLSIRFCLLYGTLILILGIYAVVWQQIIKRIPLSLAYANKAVTVVWGMIWGIIFFGETITIQKMIGAAVIIAGVIMYSFSDNKNDEATEETPS
ncbi:MAG: EamA family transporter [Clostridiales bacterium]|nr:EamA family transporter [Clostridiales bacterium]